MTLDATGPVETKLASMGEVKGVVVGAFGEGSEDLHSLIHHLAISRVRVAGPQKGKRGQERTEEAELAITTSFLRRTLSVVGVRAQAKLLLGRLEVIGPDPFPREIRDKLKLRIGDSLPFSPMRHQNRVTRV